MENRSKFGFVNSKKNGRNIFSSYDNDTFVPDQDIEIAKRNSNSLENISTENEVVDKEICSCSRDINNKTAIIYENEQSEYSSSCKCECGDIANNNTRNVSNVIDNNHNVLDTVSTDILEEREEEEKEENIKEQNEAKNSTSNITTFPTNKLPGGYEQTTDTSAVNQPPKTKTNPRKIRSFSDTRNPLRFHRLNPKLRQLEEVEVKRIDKTTLVSIDKNENDERINSEHENEHADPDKTKRNKRWIRKLAKYATFDEGVYNLPRTNKSTNDFTSTNENGEQNEIPKTENSESGLKDNAPPQRKISTGKLIKQSMSQGFSKFKQLSISGKSSSRKFEQEYAMIDNDLDFHETSKRLDQSDMLPSIFGPDPSLPTNLFRRCSSLPDLIDTSSICDEELNELYLPRRMAICPDLAVPAMKQLRTYLVLTRLKQYCIV